MTSIPLDMKNPVINNAPYESYWRLVSDPPPAPGAGTAVRSGSAGKPLGSSPPPPPAPGAWTAGFKDDGSSELSAVSPPQQEHHEPIEQVTHEYTE